LDVSVRIAVCEVPGADCGVALAIVAAVVETAEDADKGEVVCEGDLFGERAPGVGKIAGQGVLRDDMEAVTDLVVRAQRGAVAPEGLEEAEGCDGFGRSGDTVRGTQQRAARTTAASTPRGPRPGGWEERGVCIRR